MENMDLEQSRLQGGSRLQGWRGTKAVRELRQLKGTKAVRAGYKAGSQPPKMAVRAEYSKQATQGNSRQRRELKGTSWLENLDLEQGRQPPKGPIRADYKAGSQGEVLKGTSWLENLDLEQSRLQSRQPGRSTQGHQLVRKPGPRTTGCKGDSRL